MITKIEILNFIKDRNNEIKIRECDKNALIFYETFKDRGASIREGIADSYRNGILTGTHRPFGTS